MAALDPDGLEAAGLHRWSIPELNASGWTRGDPVEFVEFHRACARGDTPKALAFRRMVERERRNGLARMNAGRRPK